MFDLWGRIVHERTTVPSWKDVSARIAESMARAMRAQNPFST